MKRILLPLALLGPALAHADHVQLPPVVVSASTPAEEARQALQAEQALTPGGVTLIESDELSRRNISNIADALRYAPGVWTTSASGSDASFISIRGSNLDAVDYDGNGVKLMQDGLPVTAADGNNHNRFMDPMNARHVIVARGANALTYGASTLGGAIDFITPTALDSPPLEIFLNGGSFGQAQGRISAGKIAGDFDGLVTIEGKHRDGYREHNQQDRNGIHANLGWQLGNAVRTRFYLSHVQNDEELPGTLSRAQWRENPRQASTEAVAGDFQWNVQARRLANKTTWNIDADSSLTIGLSYEEQELFHPIVYNPPPAFSLLIDSKQETAGSSLRYNVRKGDHDVLAGFDYGQMTVKGGNYSNNRGNPGFLMWNTDNDAENLELFAMDRWRFAPHWTAVYGVQAVQANREIREISGGATTRNPKADYDSINPRAGLIYHVSPAVDVFTNFSRLYEAPTTYQLDDEASGGNRTLDAMHGNVVEIGTRGTHETGKNRFRWELAAYYAKLKDEILSIDDPAAPGTSLSMNVDQTTHAGVEALFGGSFALDAAGGHRIEPLLSLTLNRFRFDSDPVYGDNKLPAAPDLALRGELLYRNASGFFVGPTFDFVGDRYADFSNSYTIDSYALWGLRFGVVRKDWELYAEIRNIADKDYIARHSVKDVAAPTDAILSPGEPRSAYVGVRLMY